jgi:hypothetical protein
MSMKTSPLLKWLLGLLAACNEARDTKAAQPAEDPCVHVGDAVRSIWDRQVADAPDDATKQGARQMRDKAVGRLQRHCRADQWSPEVIQCVIGGSATCTNKMTPEQAQKLNSDKLE